MQPGSSKKHLVIGGTGQLGVCLLRFLVSVGRGVRALVRSLDRFYKTELEEEVEVIECDLSNKWLLRRAIEGSSVVYYCATKWVTEPQDAITEMIWMETIARACSEFDVRLIVPTCAWAYGKPRENPIRESHPLLANSPYGVAKACVEHVVLKQSKITGLPVTVLRVPAMWGPYARCPVTLNAIKAVGKGRPYRLFGSGESRVEWIDPRDVARVMFSCANAEETIGRVYNVPGSGAIQWVKFATWVTKVANTGAAVRVSRDGVLGRIFGRSSLERSLSWWYRFPVILDGTALLADLKFEHTYQLKQSILDNWRWYANLRPGDPLELE